IIVIHHDIDRVVHVAIVPQRRGSPRRLDAFEGTCFNSLGHDLLDHHATAQLEDANQQIHQRYQADGELDSRHPPPPLPIVIANRYAHTYELMTIPDTWSCHR